jgi:hypothetical protein
VNYGDGSGVHRLSLNPDNTFALNHVYVRPGVFIVTVTVTDKHGDLGRATFKVAVLPAIPHGHSFVRGRAPGRGRVL